jgi:3-(3-hydroxy-phenyl)propionate hydroxylase
MTAPRLALPHPVVVVGAGPVGLTAALGLVHHGIAVVVLEDEDRLSTDTKAGTTLSRTLEVWRRFGVVDGMLARALRVDEIGEIDRATNRPPFPVRLYELAAETRYPFVINMPQHHMEPVLQEALERVAPGAIRFDHKLVGLEQRGDHVRLEIETPAGRTHLDATYVLGCDGGQSAVRRLLGFTAEGTSFPERYALIDLEVDLDVGNPRDYPYLAYFSDAKEWMILVRHPHCWRFLFPLPDEVEEPSAESLRDKALAFIGDVANVKVINKVVYRTHHRVANRWHDGRVFLLGDAAHLITPMWALGLNTGVLDASNLPWRLAWRLRGWATDDLLAGYEREQRPIALDGSGQMSQAARAYMAKRAEGVQAMTANNWSNACTRAMLGVRLDVAGTGQGSMVKTETMPPIAAGDRIPDMLLQSPEGREVRVHDLCDDRFLALYFTDTRRRPPIPRNESPALAHFAVSRWDAPLDSGLRDRALLDPGDRFFARLGVPANSVVLIRPDEHVAAIAPMGDGVAEGLYAQVTGAPVIR